MAVQKLLFVDTNIWLDFYRARTEAGLALLDHVEKVSDRLIATFQLEMEFKKNRQAAIIDGLNELKVPPAISRPGLLSDAKAFKALQTGAKAVDKRVKVLRSKMGKVIANPTSNDPVYQACQRMFHAESPYVLTRENPAKNSVRRRAYKRFMYGCPPRKKGDTSFGDSFNWEWIIDCAVAGKAEVVIVSRDSDYGISYENKAYINDHLKQEFSERVSRRRKVVLFTKLSEALKQFEVKVTPQEEESEEQMMSASVRDDGEDMSYTFG